MQRRLFLALVVALLFLTITSSFPQTPAPQQPTFRASVALVPIDVAVTDSKGRPVLDLTKEDFLVFEDGVPQEIRHVSLERVATEAGAPVLASPVLRPVPVLELAPPQRRVFLVALSSWRGSQIEHPSKALTALLQFVREQVRPQDQIAVMAYNRATTFTTDRASIAQVIERFQARSAKIASMLEQWFSGLRAIYGSGKIPDFIQRDIDAVFDVPGGAAVRELPISDRTRRSGATPPIAAAPAAIDAGASGSTGTSFEAMRDAEMDFDEYVATSLQTMQGLSQVFCGIQYMRHIEGQKHLLFMGGSLYLPQLDDDASLAAMANDARVAIDVIQTGGILGPTIRQGALTGAGGDLGGVLDNRSLRDLARLTGGQAFIATYAKPAFDRIDNVTSAQYLLGYYPSNPNWDGKYRRVEVKVKRPGVQVSSRHGYYGRRTVVPYDRKQFLAYTRIASAGSADMELHDIRLKADLARATETGSPHGAQMRLTIDISKIAFEHADDRQVARFRIAVFFGDDKARLVDERWDTMELKLKEETYRKMLETGVDYTFPLPVKVRPKYVKIIVYNYQSDIVGSLEKQLR